MILARSIAFTQNNYDKILSVQKALEPQSENGYTFDDAVNRIITQCKLKEVLPKK